jgi:hypothetical protein
MALVVDSKRLEYERGDGHGNLDGDVLQHAELALAQERLAEWPVLEAVEGENVTALARWLHRKLPDELVLLPEVVDEEVHEVVDDVGCAGSSRVKLVGDEGAPRGGRTFIALARCLDVNGNVHEAK